MERVVCIPVEQYILMLQTYDELTEQVREMREILENPKGTKGQIKKGVSHGEDKRDDQRGAFGRDA